MTIQKTIRSLRRFANDLDAERVLGTVGLARRRALALPALGILTIGLIGGAAIVLLAMPEKREKVREAIVEKAKTARADVTTGAKKLEKDALEAKNGLVDRTHS